jgi:hypothetical protein
MMAVALLIVAGSVIAYILACLWVMARDMDNEF